MERKHARGEGRKDTMTGKVSRLKIENRNRTLAENQAQPTDPRLGQALPRTAKEFSEVRLAFLARKLELLSPRRGSLCLQWLFDSSAAGVKTFCHAKQVQLTSTFAQQIFLIRPKDSYSPPVAEQ
jgi:hypothetical protein